jgi:quercetin dioxygenase-like cupin family protein
MMHYKVDFASIPWESPIEGVRQKIHNLGGEQLRLVEYSKDLVPHWCAKGHVGYILKGEIEVRFEHGIQHYSPGDGIVIPGGEEHKHMAKVLTDIVTVIFFEDA